jgi:hypothetical protein
MVLPAKIQLQKPRKLQKAKLVAVGAHESLHSRVANCVDRELGEIFLGAAWMLTVFCLQRLQAHSYNLA